MHSAWPAPSSACHLPADLAVDSCLGLCCQALATLPPLLSLSLSFSVTPQPQPPMAQKEEAAAEASASASQNGEDLEDLEDPEKLKELIELPPFEIVTG